jgi:hypothetical protein
MSQDGKRLDSREDLTYLPLETICRCQINQEVRKFIRSSYSYCSTGGSHSFSGGQKAKSNEIPKRASSFKQQKIRKRSAPAARLLMTTGGWLCGYIM